MPYFSDAEKRLAVHCGDVREQLRLLPAGSTQCCVTSPPYWALRDYGVEGQLGMEATPEEFIANMVDVFREARRVLRDDGTLWLNMGDTYAKTGGKGDGPHEFRAGRTFQQRNPAVSKVPTGYKPGDMIGIPAKLAEALRADGWYLRAEIIWHKRSPMPESVRNRPTKAHEYVFLLTKSRKYFYDVIGSQEATTGNAHSRGHGVNPKAAATDFDGVTKQNNSFSAAVKDLVATRNMRSVWSLSNHPFKGKHFAAFPPELVRRCLSAGVSVHGCCPTCGAAWVRIVEKVRRPTRPGEKTKITVPGGWDVGTGSHGSVNRAGRTESTYSDLTAETFRDSLVVGNRDAQRHVTEKITVGWKPGCQCEAADPVPCTVLDPFHGAGTTMCVSRRLGYAYVGVELNPAYIDLSIERLSQPIIFPHERKTAKKRRPKVAEQSVLF